MRNKGGHQGTEMSNSDPGGGIMGQTLPLLVVWGFQISHNE